jgi:endo-1,3-1,4-beta-glycanase ExoK
MSITGVLRRTFVTDPVDFWTEKKTQDVSVDEAVGVYVAAAAWPLWMLLGPMGCGKQTGAGAKPDAGPANPGTAPDAAKNDLAIKYDIVHVADGIVPIMPDLGELDSITSLDGGRIDLIGLPDLQALDAGPAETSPPDADNSLCPAVLPPTTNPLFVDNLDSFNSSLWARRSGANSSPPFDSSFDPGHITFVNGFMDLTLDNNGCPAGCSNLPYVSGEYGSNAVYGYFLLEGSMKPTNVSGTDVSFFIYASNGDEIDIEFVPDPQGPTRPVRLQTNYYNQHVGGHEAIIPLTFDPSQDFHEYAIDRIKRDDGGASICWYVDKNRVRQVDSSANTVLPVTAGGVKMNYWVGTPDQAGWIGPYTYNGPTIALYDWVRVTLQN